LVRIGVKRFASGLGATGGGIRGGLVLVVVTGVVLLLVSAGLVCTLGGRGGGDVRDVDGSCCDGGGGGGVDRDTGILLFPVNCTGNIRVIGTGVG
jgi:hypothetical protein